MGRYSSMSDDPTPSLQSHKNQCNTNMTKHCQHLSQPISRNLYVPVNLLTKTLKTSLNSIKILMRNKINYIKQKSVNLQITIMRSA